MRSTLPPPIDGPSAQDLARQELSRPEYGHGDRSLLQRILDAVGRFLARLGDSVGGGAVSTVLLVLAAVALLLLVVALVRAGALPGRRRRRADPDADPLAGDTDADHLARAAALREAGDLAGALREYLRDAVATLERSGRLSPRPGRTGAGAAREGGDVVPAARDDLLRAGAAFDAVWFGRRPATAEDVAIAAAAAATVRAHASGVPARAGRP